MKKLTLKRETLKNLSNDVLARIGSAGGAPPAETSVEATCVGGAGQSSAC